jgi:hypothetical protein
MNTHRFVDLIQIIGLEVRLPETVFELHCVGVGAFVEGLHNFNCLHIRESQLLTFHLLDEKLNVFLFAIADAGVKTPEDGTHAILTSIASNVWFEFDPSDRI